MLINSKVSYSRCQTKVQAETDAMVNQKRSNAGTRKGNIESLLNKEFRSEFEVHRIVVIPFPTPNEAMFFEDRDDLLGHAVTISDRAGMRLPVPVIRVGSI